MRRELASNQLCMRLQLTINYTADALTIYTEASNLLQASCLRAYRSQVTGLKRIVSSILTIEWSNGTKDYLNSLTLTGISKAQLQLIYNLIRYKP